MITLSSFERFALNMLIATVLAKLCRLGKYTKLLIDCIHEIVTAKVGLSSFLFQKIEKLYHLRKPVQLEE